MIIRNARASYVVLKEPKPNLSKVLKYSMSLLVPKEDKKMVKEIQAEIAKAIEKGKSTKWGGKIPKFRYEPLRDGDAEIASGEKEKGKGYEGHFFINATSDDPPGIAGPNGQGTMNREIVYSGCIVHADVNAFPYDNGGNKGIGWGLNNVMFVADGERLDGRQTADDAFAEFAAPAEDDAENGLL